MIYKRLTLYLKTLTGLKSTNGKTNSTQTREKKRENVAILLWGRRDFKTKTVTRHKKDITPWLRDQLIKKIW